MIKEIVIEKRITGDKKGNIKANVPFEEWQALKEIAKQTNRTPQEVFRILMRDILKKVKVKG